VEQQEVSTPAPPGSSWFHRRFVHRRPQWVTTLLPAVVLFSVWLPYMAFSQRWSIFGSLADQGMPQMHGYYAFLLMLFAGFVAGISSEGGGSVAFPVLSIGLSVSAAQARDFSFMVQSIGMVSAAFSIWYSRYKICGPALVYGALGGALGIVLCLRIVKLSDSLAKMLFVAVFFAFAINLFILNRQRKRLARTELKDAGARTKLILFCTGVVGGVLSGIAGSGLDIVMFAVLTLVFRLSEKVNTATSVCLMATNTLFGFFFRSWFVQDEIARSTYSMWLCGIAACGITAPLGALCSSYLHRHVLASMVYITDTFQFVAALILVKQTPALLVATFGTVLLSLLAFYWMRWMGNANGIQEVTLGSIVSHHGGAGDAMTIVPVARVFEAARAADPTMAATVPASNLLHAV
jgi:uncharacterized membrane protein YfcA